LTPFPAKTWVGENREMSEPLVPVQLFSVGPKFSKPLDGAMLSYLAEWSWMAKKAQTSMLSSGSLKTRKEKVAISAALSLEAARPNRRSCL